MLRKKKWEQLSFISSPSLPKQYILDASHSIKPGRGLPNLLLFQEVCQYRPEIRGPLRDNYSPITLETDVKI